MLERELNAAIAAHVAGDRDDAEARYRRLISAYPNAAIPYSNLALICIGSQRGDEALALLRRAVNLNAGFAEAWRNLGNLLATRGAAQEAIDCLQRAVAIRPEFADAHNDLGNIRRRTGDNAGAIAHYRAAADAQPDYVPLYNLGCALLETGDAAAAVQALDAALVQRPDQAPALSALGNAHRALGDAAAAEHAYRRALACDPRSADALTNLGNLLKELERFDEARDVFAELVTLDPENPRARLEQIVDRMARCDWSHAARDLADLEALYRSRRLPAPPFHALCAFDDPPLLLDAARHYAGLSYPAASTAAPAVTRPGARIRVAYLSADFHDHATARLAAELFELHDRRRFEIHAISTGADDRSDMRARLTDAIEFFHDLHGQSPQAIADHIRALGIDVAVDLKGHTVNTPLAALAARPAPVQVHYLGYPGSLGCDFIDYLIVDETLVPDAERAHYLEPLVRLPGCYQINDRRRRIAHVATARAEHGLADDAFVYCCFNGAHKLTPTVFAVWMRILQAVPASQLWLWAPGDAQRANLSAAAHAAGVDPARLVFAGSAPLAQHLERLRHADLFLDTYPYSAHTTGSDALWAGVPVLTRRGRSFASRVGASLLQAVGLGALAVDDAQAYEQRAIALATGERAALHEARSQLRRHAELPLFDAPRTTRMLERAYAAMVARQRAGLAPEGFTVAEHDEAETPETPMPPDDPSFVSRVPYGGCPLCDAPVPATPIVTADASRHALYRPPLDPQMRWHQCAQCHHVFTDGYFSDEALALVFAQVQPNQRVGADLENQRLISARLIDRVLPYAAQGAWLDVGFGNGALLLTAAEYGFEAVGVDLRQDNVDTIRQLGVQAHAVDLTQWSQPGRFAVASLCDVLEHFAYPLQALRALHGMLAEDGILLLSMPNSDSVLWTLLSLNRANPYWSELEHYHNFGRDRLYRLLDECGFDVLRYGVSERYRVGMEIIARRR